MRGFRRNKKGFTLVELLIVMAIIAILGTIVTASVIAIQRNSERKSAQTALTNYWRLSSQYLDQVNRKLTSNGTPQQAALGVRLNDTTIVLSTNNCTSLKNEQFYIQYEENPKSVSKRFTIKRIIYNHEGTYYKTEDGKTISYSKKL